MVLDLPEALPITDGSHVLAGYNKDPATLMPSLLPNDLWQHWDPIFNGLIPQDIESVCPLAARGEFGLIGLAKLFLYLVEYHGVDGNMLDGKTGRIREAIDIFIDKQIT